MYVWMLSVVLARPGHTAMSKWSVTLWGVLGSLWAAGWIREEALAGAKPGSLSCTELRIRLVGTPSPNAHPLDLRPPQSL